uniref:Uncharacterized protein n=1 Tax=Romanomermis culicivorax TaxID=13658 RepID=A0A915J0N7_ROMCU
MFFLSSRRRSKTATSELINLVHVVGQQFPFSIVDNEDQTDDGSECELSTTALVQPRVEPASRLTSSLVDHHTKSDEHKNAL